MDEWMVYKHTVSTDTAWFAWGPPFVASDAHSLVTRLAKHPAASQFVLANTLEGRAVPALRIAGKPANRDREKLGIWIQARQHAWESGSSWVGKGFIEWLLSDDRRAVSLRQRADITFVPLMDVDNVTRGAGGKNETPHDHNRDWSSDPRHPAVRAAQKHIDQMNRRGQFDLFVDLHNPGPNDRQPYFYVPPKEFMSDLGRTRLNDLVHATVSEMNGPLLFTPNTRVSGSGYDRMWKSISKNWVAANTDDHVVAVTLETSWNTSESNVDGYTTVGKQLGLAIERWSR